jgi:hypothetical protein
MDNHQIESILANDSLTRSLFNGVYPENGIPNRYMRGFIIVNTISNPNEMGHWLLLFSNSVFDVIFMDSFAFTPNVYGGNIEMYCSKFKNVVLFNKYPIQSANSLTCGAYCIFIAFKLCANMSVNSIRRLLPYSNKKKNDRVVECFVNCKINSDVMMCENRKCNNIRSNAMCCSIY